jgi:glycosyltransferase involved in cell wall biosynthesis
MLHNYYQQQGGEDNSFASEVKILREHKHEVFIYTRHNDELKNMSVLIGGIKAFWNSETYKALTRLICEINPDIAHFHNIFPLISPAGYFAAKISNVPVIQTLHNYRFICPGALFFRKNRICEDCLGKHLFWPGIMHACYRKSRPSTAIVSLMNSLHFMIGTWENKVDAYIVLTDFFKEKFVKGGLPAEKIFNKPNFVEDFHKLSKNDFKKRGKGGAFVGRLSKEKGIETLLEAWEILEEKIPLIIIGEGPLEEKVVKASQKCSNIIWLGHQKFENVLNFLEQIEYLIFPSQWYEGMPRIIIESFMHGTPVIASNLGAMSTMIEHKRTGLFFESGNSHDLAVKVLWAHEHPEAMARMGREARKEYEAKYTPESNYNKIMNIYSQVLSRQGNI